MRNRRRRAGGVSLGTIVVLVITGLVIGGCVVLMPKLMGDIELRVDPQRVGVAIDESLRNLRDDSSARRSPTEQATPATAPPMATLAPTPTQAVTRSFTLTAGGAIGIDTAIQKAFASDSGYQLAPLFENIAPALTGSLNLATLENLTVADEKLTNVNMPVDALAALKATGFTTLSNGFTNALDYGVAGISATQNALSQNGITGYGAYATSQARSQVNTVQIGDIKVALLGYQGDLSSAGKKKTTKEEREFVTAPLDLPVIAADISAARNEGAHVVIVSLSWGKAGATEPTAAQVELAQGIADAGADIILGTRSAAVQPVTILTARRADGSTSQTLCAYSLGNLLESNRDKREALAGILLHVNMTYEMNSGSLMFEDVTFTPTFVWRGKIDGKNTYRILQNNATPPDYVQGDQLKLMERCLKLIRDRLAGSLASEAL